MKTLLSKSDKRFLDTDDRFGNDEFGSVSWNVKLEPINYRSKKEKRNIARIDADLRLTDCFKVITLSFHCDAETSEIDARVQKLDTLIESLKRMREAMLDAKMAGYAYAAKPYIEEGTSANDDDLD